MMELNILNTDENYGHGHPEVELLYILKGRLNVTVNQKVYELCRDDVIIINSDAEHRLMRSGGDGDLWYCRIWLDYRELLEDLERDYALFWCNSAVNKSGEYRQLTGILEELLEAFTSAAAGTYIKKSMYYKLVACLADHFMLRDGAKTWAKDSSYERDRLLLYIQSNYYRSISLQELADRYDMSETVFSRYFKKLVGMNFVQYVNNVRLNHSVKDLLYTDHPITRIAVDNGFSSASFYNRVFKSVYDTTPTAFRELHRSGADAQNAEAALASNEAVSDFLRLRGQTGQVDIQSTQVTADMSAAREYRKVWTRAFNLGMAADMLSSRLQSQIEIVKNDIGFEYGRIQNIFSPAMKLRSGHDTKNLRFDNLNTILDFMVDHHIIPMIDLGDRPEYTSRDFGYDIYFAERIKIFESLDEYKEVLTALVDHVRHRYGREAFRQWIFELWFDPGDQYGPTPIREMKDYDYTQVFLETARILKSREPEICLGGAGILVEGPHCPVLRFFEQLGQLEYAPDFISAYMFPYSNIDESDVMGSIVMPHTEFFRRTIKSYEKLSDHFSLGNRKFFVTDWNLSLSQRNVYNDSCGKAAIMLKNMVDNLEAVDMGIYESISDMGADYFDSDSMLFGAGGMVSKEGVPKPAYYAMKFMAGLFNFIVDQGDGYIITSDKNGRYAILIFNYKTLGQLYYLRKESEITVDDHQEIYEDKMPRIFHFALEHIDAGTWHLRRYSISPEHGSILRVWQQLGRDTSVRENVEYMRRICTPELSIRNVDAQGTTLVFEETLAAHEMCFLVLGRD